MNAPAFSQHRCARMNAQAITLITVQMTNKTIATSVRPLMGKITSRNTAPAALQIGTTDSLLLRYYPLLSGAHENEEQADLL